MLENYKTLSDFRVKEGNLLELAKNLEFRSPLELAKICEKKPGLKLNEISDTFCLLLI